jgi:hypothetical protein
MAYTQAEFIADVVRAARAHHLAYERGQFILARWYAEFSAGVPNDATEVAPGITGAEITNVIVRCSEQIADMEAGGSAKLNTILAVSDLPLGS